MQTLATFTKKMFSITLIMLIMNLKDTDLHVDENHNTSALQKNFLHWVDDHDHVHVRDDIHERNVMITIESSFFKRTTGC